MNLYEFALPHMSNDRKVDYSYARKRWEAAALDVVGGFTGTGVSDGVWRGDDGKGYAESMHGYRVACSPEIKDQLLAKAFELFPDQLAIFASHIGWAEIVERPR
jgi:hypothetical protein